MRSQGVHEAEVLSYETYRELIKNGDVLLYRGTGWMSWLIQKVTRSPYSHAGVAAWWNTRLMVLEAVGKGVVASPLSENLKRYHGRVDYFWCATAIADPQRTQMLDFAQMQLGKEYNLMQVIMNGVRTLLGVRIKNRKGRFKHAAGTYFCSQYVSDVYCQANVDLGIDLSSDRVTPESIAKSPALVLKGILKAEGKPQRPRA